jgi:hypothetical protein
MRGRHNDVFAWPLDRIDLTDYICKELSAVTRQSTQQNMTMRSKKPSIHESRGRFGSKRGPSVAPAKVYEPNRPAQRPAGYDDIEAASQMAQDSREFLDFVREVVNLPVQMAPAVAEAIRQKKWRISPNPLGAIRTASHQEAKRLGIG